MDFLPSGMAANVALIIGIAAVILFLLSYLQKSRKAIITLNVTSRILYILQYILLGAYVGAVLDVAGAISSVLAQKKNTAFVKRHMKQIVVAVNLLIVALGILTIVVDTRGKGVPLLSVDGAIGLLPIFGVLLHTGAFWMDDEKKIRRVSLLGSPFWFAYNLLTAAYGSCIGDLLSMLSIFIAMVRYDFKRKKPKSAKEEAPPAE